MKKYRTISLYILFAFTAFLMFKIYQGENRLNTFKADAIEIANVKYGLFNVDEWKSILADIITEKINDFDIDADNRQNIESRISTLLTTVIDQFEESYYQKNASSISGFFQGSIASLTGVFSRMKEDIPMFSEEIVNFINKEGNRDSIREYILLKLDEYTQSTFAEFDYTYRDNILVKYGISDANNASNVIGGLITQEQSSVSIFKNGILLIWIICFAFLFFIRRVQRAEVYALLGISSIFLFAGIFIPMIEIDARINSLSFELLSTNIEFTNQVLFYKSKSIIDVVSIMLFQKRLDLILVGFGIFAFSIFFPLLKLMSTAYYIENKEIRSTKFVSFFVFRSGKWSMADVMVIAIFMAYIGFSGILTEQLTQLENLSPSLDIISTNESNLRTGFYLFSGYVLLSLMISQKTKYSENL
jgi:hypothetical protein